MLAVALSPTFTLAFVVAIGVVTCFGKRRHVEAVLICQAQLGNESPSVASRPRQVRYAASLTLRCCCVLRIEGEGGEAIGRRAVVLISLDGVTASSQSGWSTESIGDPEIKNDERDYCCGQWALR